MIVAVVPAAGHSTRMGRPKLALPYQGRTVLEHVVAVLRDGGVEHVVVVIGPHVPELSALAQAAGADVCKLVHATLDMRTTVEHGLEILEEHYHPLPEDAFLLAPADHPAFDAEVVRILYEAYLRGPARSILVPVHGGRRGHPTLIGWQHVAGIRAMSDGYGINSYLRGNPAQIQEVPVAQPGILFDLDTSDDYARLK